MRMRRGAVPPVGQAVALDPLDVVRAAMAGEPVSDGASRRRVPGGEFSMTTVSPALRKLAVLFAIYLCFASLRIHEVVTILAIPKLPMLMSLVLAAGLVLGVPPRAWRQLWIQIPAMRWQTLIIVLAIGTIPLGIWVSNSLDRLYPGYFLAVTVMAGAMVLLRDRTVLTRTIQYLTLIVAGLTVLGLLGAGSPGTDDIDRIGLGQSLDPNDFAWVLATFVPLALWLAVRNKATAIFWFGIAALLVLGIVPTQSRGGLVALMAAGGTLILAGASGWRRILMLVALAGLGVALISFAQATGASRLTDFASYEGGTGRTELWTQGIRWMLQRPWGLGIGNYSTYNVMMTRSALGAHSAYIGIGTELGILGLCAYLAIWLGVIRGLLRLRRRAHAQVGNPWAGAEASLYGFVVAAMIGNAVGAIFLHTQYSALTLFVQGLGAAVLAGSPLHGLKAGGPGSYPEAQQSGSRFRHAAMYANRRGALTSSSQLVQDRRIR